MERLEASGAFETSALAAAFGKFKSAESGGVWGRVDEVAGDRVVVTFEAQDVRWAVFGIVYLEAPVELLEAPDELRAAIAEWRDRLGSTLV